MVSSRDMIDPLRQSTGTRAARGYAGTMAGFWTGLAGTLRALDAIAADGTRLDESAVGPLRALQYRLHWSSELLDGVRPPAGARDAHDELRDSLSGARDVTGEMVEAIELGGHDAAAGLLVLGAAAFLGGAVLIVWPLWAAGVALVAAALLVQRS